MGRCFNILLQISCILRCYSRSLGRNDILLGRNDMRQGETISSRSFRSAKNLILQRWIDFVCTFPDKNTGTGFQNYRRG